MSDKIITLPNGDNIIIGQEDRRSTQFNIEDLYKYRFVESGEKVFQGGKYVAKVGDLIYDFTMGMFKVARVYDYIADLVLWELPKTPANSGNEDILLGVGPGYTSETWVALLNTTVFPHRLDIDGRLHVNGSEAKEMKVFYGVNIGPTGEVISAYYDQSNNYKGDSIPLEVVGTKKINNVAIKTPKMGYSRRQLEDGELVTAVFYGVHGNVLSVNKLKIYRTNMVRRAEEADKRVQSIELISPYLSKVNPNTLEVPINVTVATLAIRAKVTYTDGSSRVMDVSDEDSGGKFRLLGLKFWSPTIRSTPAELTLVYRLDKTGENSYLQGEVADGMVTASYRIVAMPVDPAFSLKLYAFPKWTDAIRGWRLDYWLYDLDRTTARRLPSGAVELTDASQPFDGKDYTTVQRLQLSVNLSQVSDEYGEHRHVQNAQVALLRDGSVPGSKWKVRSSSNQVEWYGDGLTAPVKSIGGGLFSLELANGCKNLTEWLDLVYYRLDPLFDNRSEVKAPAPTHFKIITLQRTIEVPIDQWNSPITFINDLTSGDTIYLGWVKRLANNDLQLGVSGIPINRI